MPFKMLWYIDPEPPSLISVMFARWSNARAPRANVDTGYWCNKLLLNSTLTSSGQIALKVDTQRKAGILHLPLGVARYLKSRCDTYRDT